MITAELFKKHGIISVSSISELNTSFNVSIVIKFENGRIEIKSFPNDRYSSKHAERFLMSLIIHKERKSFPNDRHSLEHAERFLMSLIIHKERKEKIKRIQNGI